MAQVFYKNEEFLYIYGYRDEIFTSKSFAS